MEIVCSDMVKCNLYILHVIIPVTESSSQTNMDIRTASTLASVVLSCILLPQYTTDNTIYKRVYMGVESWPRFVIKQNLVLIFDSVSEILN